MSTLQPSIRPRIRMHPPLHSVPPRTGAVYLPPDEALVEGALLSRNLHDYVKAAWPVINQGRPFVDGWHLGAICEHLQAVSRGEIHKLLINVPFRCTKPCHVDGMVLEKTKGYIRLGDVIKGDHVLTHRGRFRRVDDVHEQGHLPVLEVITERGRTLRLEKSHPLLTSRGWVAAGKLKSGDDVLAVVHKIEPCGSDTVSLQEARLLGYLIGDGCVKYGATGFTNQDSEAIDDFIVCARSLGFMTRVGKKGGKGVTVQWVTVTSGGEECPNHPGRKTGFKTGYCSECRTAAQKIKSLKKFLKRGVVGSNYDSCVCGKRKPPHAKECWWCSLKRLELLDVPKTNHDRGMRGVVGSVRKWRIKHGLDGKCSYDKRVPPAIMSGSDEIVAEFIAAYWSCDGGLVKKPLRMSCCTVSGGLAQDLQHLLTRLGMQFSLRRCEGNFISKRQGNTYVSWAVASVGGEDTVVKFMCVVGHRMRHEKRTRVSVERTDFDRILYPDGVVGVKKGGKGKCRCLTVKEDSSFVYQGVAVHNSLTVGVFWPSWEWTFAPHVQWLCLSYAEPLSTRDSLRCRTVIDSRWYQDRWGDVFQLTTDQNVKNRYENTKHGVRISTSLGGIATGEGGDRVVIDDPHNMKEIHSEVARKEVIRIWKESLCSRLNDPATGAFVGVMQRGHEQDFSGYCLAEEGDWEHLCLPMEYERLRPVYVRQPDGERTVQQVSPKELPTSLGFVDPREKEGELLCPQRFTPAVVEKLKPSPGNPGLGVLGWSGQAQQRPTPAGGDLFLRETWRFYRRTELPTAFDEVIQSWDMAFKKTEDSSKVAGHVWARRNADRYLLYRTCKRMDFVESLKAVIATTILYPQALRKLVEDKANGTAVINLLRSKVPGLYPVEPEGSKEARAQTASIYQQAGNLLLPHPDECPWTNELIDILAGVPRGEWDDADALAQAMIYFGPVMAPIRLDDNSVFIGGAGVVESEDAPWAMTAGLR